MKRGALCIALALAAVLLWGGWLAYRARSNLVTLNVRNMEVRKVVSKIQWQTWERIIVNNDVSGKVTLNVRKMPLEAVLRIVAMQTSSRWAALYPLYSTGKSVVAFKKAVRGDMPPSESGWTNLFTAPAWRRGNNTGGFANNARAANNLVSAQIDGKDLGFTTLALSRFTQAQVVAEDGAEAYINLRLEQVPFTAAVAAVARKAHRKWDLFYTLQPPPPGLILTSVGMTNMSGPIRMSPPLSPEERAAAREREFEARLATMTPPEREAAEKQRQLMDELNALPPAERQQRLQQMARANAAAQESSVLQRMQDRLKNLTPEQRVERDRARLEKQKRQTQ
jgi:hypothetical protein